jgi:hypothetical protein
MISRLAMPAAAAMRDFICVIQAPRDIQRWSNPSDQRDCHTTHAELVEVLAHLEPLPSPLNEEGGDAPAGLAVLG